MTIVLSLLVAIVGLIVYALSANSKVQELARIAWFCGLLAFLLRMSDEAVKLFR